MKAFKALGMWLLVVGLLITVPLAAIAVVLTVDQRENTRVASPHMSAPAMGRMSISGAQSRTSSDQLTIIHVQKGCHVWSTGATRMATLRLTMKPGQVLRITNQDVDMHRMVELAGPAMMALGGPMRQGQVDSIKFTEPGVYRFDTRVSAMKGMPEVETTGPDNVLRLTVTVA